MSITELTLPPANVPALIERACRDGHPLQFLRELVQNSVEAGSTRVKIKPVEALCRQDDGSIERHAMLSVQDDGPGMSGDDLRRFFMRLGESHNPNVGDAHANFGIGGKISTLPWNKAGVVLVSKTASESSMIWLHFDKGLNRYGLRRWLDDSEELFDIVYPYDSTQDGDSDDIRVNWLDLVPNEGTGTSVVLLGSGTWSTAIPMEYHHKYYTPEFRNFLCRRYYDLPVNLTVWVPPSKIEDCFPLQSQGGSGHWNIKRVGSTKEVLMDSIKRGTVRCNSARIHWYVQADNWLESAGLREAAIRKMGISRSFIAVLYKGELYHYRYDHARWGIFDKALARRINIIIESDELIPDQTRSRLKPLTGSDVPFGEWATHFADNMPEPIVELLNESLSESQATLDPAVAERLVNELGKTFELSGSLMRKFYKDPQERGERTPSQKKRRQKSGNSKEGAKTPTKYELPRGVWEKNGKDSPPAFVVRPSTAAPAGIVKLNEENPIFCALFEEWAQRVDTLYKGAVVSIVKEAIRQDYIARVAHAGRLPWEAGYSRDDIYEILLGPEAMTVAALGIISHRALIAPRIKAQLGIDVEVK